MNFTNLLEGIEKLVVELLLWIIFIPKTIFKVVTEPGWVPDYIERDCLDKSGESDNYISPVFLFLMSSLVLFVIFEQVSVDGNRTIQIEAVANALKGSRGVLIGLGFLSLPMVFSLATEWLKREGITRNGLQRGFYIQCFYFSPLTLSVFAVVLFDSLLAEDGFIIFFSTLIITLGVLIWFIAVEIRLFARELQSGVIKAVFVFLGLTVAILASLFFVVILADDSTRDAAGYGGTEEITQQLSADGDITISIRSFDETRGDYRLTLKNNDVSTETLPVVERGADERNLVYGQSVNGTVPQGGVSEWVFEGQDEDNVNITVEPLDVMFDPVIELRDAQGISILDKRSSSYYSIIGYFYIFVSILAVRKGARLLFRKPSDNGG